MKSGEQKKNSNKSTGVQPLSYEKASFKINLDGLNFNSTDDLEPTQEAFGQSRALDALKIGMGIGGDGYHIFATGLTGTKKLAFMSDLVAKMSDHGVKRPDDIVFVHNFKKSDEPAAIHMEAGDGKKLKSDMRRLVETLSLELPDAFRQEKFEQEKQNLSQSFEKRAREMAESLEKESGERGLALQRTPEGELFFAPKLNGEPVKSQEEYEKIPEEDRKAIEENQREMTLKLKNFAMKNQELFRELSKKIKEIEKQFAKDFISPIIFEISSKYKRRETREYLADVERHILDNLDQFKRQDAEASSPFMPPFMRQPPDESKFNEYEVNLLVDNSEREGAPIVVESLPNFKNLFGSIDRIVDRYGKIVTNFTRIKPGAFLKANGGVLIINIDEAVYEPLVWRTMLRTLKSSLISIDTYDPWAMFTPSGIKPEPIEINVKVVLVGSPHLYYMLYQMEPDFKDVFKIRCDFAYDTEYTKENALTFARNLAAFARSNELPPFGKSAVAKLLEASARETGDRERMLAQFPALSDAAQEAAYFAKQDGSKTIEARHVALALEGRDYRNSRIEERMRQMILEDSVKIETSGAKVGQINGLAVLQIAGRAFGKPSRITASVSKGSRGIVNIERESKLSGSIHDKGVLILSGYLYEKYGRDATLQLSASIAFEQSYSGVDGDSASSAELYALLSAVSGLPLRQDLAVTGSVNQKGEIQAIGGVNEKIEGFYEICKARRFTGSQGVIIPASNVRNLILKDEVLKSIKKGEWNVFAVSTVDEGMEILTGMKAGDVSQNDTIHAIVMKELKKLSEKPKDDKEKDKKSDPKKEASKKTSENKRKGTEKTPKTNAKAAKQPPINKSEGTGGKKKSK